MTTIILRDPTSKFSIAYDPITFGSEPKSFEYNKKNLNDACKKDEISQKTEEYLLAKLEETRRERARAAATGDFLDDFLGTI